ncbi:asparagine synthetase [Alternaria alternata]|nr:asparagine synthetase [Alternaria alternata]
MPKPGTTNKAENPRAEARETRPESPLTTSDQRMIDIAYRNATSSPLLRLPPEIRNMIFALVLTEEGTIYLFYIRNGWRYQNDFQISLLRVCRQVYTETCLLPYKLNTFDFYYIYVLERFVSWVFDTMNVLSRVAENATGRREQPRGSRPSTVSQPTTRVFNHESRPLNDTKAQVIMPASLSDAGKPKSYVLILDCSSKPLESNENPVINIAASTDIELFQALRVWQGLRLRSFTGAIRAFFSLWSSRLELKLVERDHVGRLSVIKGGFENGLPELRSQWRNSGQKFPPPEELLNHLYNRPEHCHTLDTWFLEAIPQRSSPVLASELSCELDAGPIPVLVLRRTLDYGKGSLTVTILNLLVSVRVALLQLKGGSMDIQSAISYTWYIILAWVLIISFVVFVPFPNSRFNNRLPKHGFCRTIFQCDCGHHIVTERLITESEQATIRILYGLGLRKLRAGLGPLKLNEEWANDLTTNFSMPFPSRSESHSANETSGDIADQSTGVSSSSRFEDYGQPSVTNRCHKSHQGDDVIRFITKDDRPTDRVLIESLKKEYNSLRPYYVRLRALRDFSTIRLARFKYYSTTRSKAPKAVDWKWPDPAKCDWETVSGLEEPIDDSGLAQLMLHLWIEGCRTENKKATTPEKEKEAWLTLLIMKFKDKTQTIPLHTSNAPPPLGLQNWPRHITLFLSGLKAPKSAKGNEPDVDQPMPLDMKRISLEIDYGTHLADPHTIYYHTPQKLHTSLKPDPTGRNPPVGWAIWIDEDFSVPWYLILALILIIIATCVFASFYGWPIGSYIIAATGLVMTGWVLRAKDSKHPRLD